MRSPYRKFGTVLYQCIEFIGFLVTVLAMIIKGVVSVSALIVMSIAVAGQILQSHVYTLEGFNYQPSIALILSCLSLFVVGELTETSKGIKKEKCAKSQTKQDGNPVSLRAG